MVAATLAVVAGCVDVGPPAQRTVQLSPPAWLHGTWCTVADLACFDITSGDVVWRTYKGESFSLRYDFQSSVSDSAPTDQYYVVYVDGDKYFSFTRLSDDLVSVWQAGMNDTMLYWRE